MIQESYKRQGQLHEMIQKSFKSQEQVQVWNHSGQQPQKTGTTAGNDGRHAGKDMENSKYRFRTGAVDRNSCRK
jgi:hypothetical protein